MWQQFSRAGGVRSSRSKGSALLGLSVFVVALVAGCGGSVEGAGSGGGGAPTATESVPPVEVTVPATVPDGEDDLIQDVVEGLGVGLVRGVELGAPPDPAFAPVDDLPGDLWLYVDVGVTDRGATGDQVRQRWEAALVAGDVRTAAAESGFPVPFGYSVVPIVAGGSVIEEDIVSIVIGAPIDIENARVSDPEAERARIEAAATALGLKVVDLEFVGRDAAVVLSVQSDGSGEALLRQWPDVMAGLFGDRMDYPWYVEGSDGSGETVVTVGNSPTTWGSNSWIRPDLRELWLELTHGGSTSSSEAPAEATP